MLCRKCWRLLKAGMACTARAEFQGFNFFLEGLNTDLAMTEKNKVIFTQETTNCFPAAQCVLGSLQIQQICHNLSI